MIRALIDRYFIKQPRLRSIVTRMLYGEKDREVEIFGTMFLINALRENGYLRAAKKSDSSSLLKDEVSALISLALLLRPGDTFVDVGANIGIFCRTLSRINLFPGNHALRFYAYEPHPDTFQRLKWNVRNTSIIARNTAVSNQNGQLDFVDGAVSHVFTVASRSKAYNLKDSHRCVPCVRLDEESIGGDSIILKIDVEDQELAVLNGAAKWFEAKRIKALYLDNYADASAVDSLLKHFGFTLLNCRDLESPSVSGSGTLALRM
jgi:FkbM family methyltransferase